jgi:hypothetical protein
VRVGVLLFQRNEYYLRDAFFVGESSRRTPYQWRAL